MNTPIVQRYSRSLLLVLLGAVTACDSKTTSPATTATAIVSASPAVAARVADNRSSAKVASIVFVTKEHPCECTRKKIEAVETALRQVLGNPSKVPVEILKADIEPEKIEPYRQQKPVVALPAVYFVAGRKAGLAWLQGEVPAAQIQDALGH